MGVPTTQEILALIVITEGCPICHLSIKEAGGAWHIRKVTGPKSKVVATFPCSCGNVAKVVLPPFEAPHLNYEITWNQNVN